MIDKFEIKTIEEHTQITASYLPNDDLHSAKNFRESRLYKLLKGISRSFKDIDDLYSKDWKNLNILTCDDEEFLNLWEASVGIPDNIFKQTSGLSIEQRKNQVLTKLKSLGILRKEDMQELATLLGLNISIKTGMEASYPPYDVPFTPIGGGEKFILVISSQDFDTTGYPPYDVPFTPTGSTRLLIDLFESIKPSNSLLIVN